MRVNSFERRLSDLKEIQQSYPIDIEFDIAEPEDKDDINLIFIKIEINTDKGPGYSISTQGVGVFSFDKNAELHEEEKQQLILFSAVNMCITNLRSFIANLTSYYPLGKFNFASIDLNDLINKKAGNNL